MGSIIKMMKLLGIKNEEDLTVLVEAEKREWRQVSAQMFEEKLGESQLPLERNNRAMVNKIIKQLRMSNAPMPTHSDLDQAVKFLGFRTLITLHDAINEKRFPKTDKAIEALRADVAAHPEDNQKTIAARLGRSTSWVSVMIARHHISHNGK